LDFKRRADGGRARAFKIQFVPLPFVHITRQLTYEALRDFCAVTFFVLLFFYYFWWLLGMREASDLLEELFQAVAQLRPVGRAYLHHLIQPHLERSHIIILFMYSTSI
jgi:hypothetical protein